MNFLFKKDDLYDEIEQLKFAKKQATEVIKGLMEIAEIAMPDTFFASDSRTTAAREFLKGEYKAPPETDLGFPPGVWLGINISGQQRLCAGWLYSKIYGSKPEDQRPEIVWRSDSQ